MTDQELDHLTRQVENLKPSEQLLLMERIIALLKRQNLDDEITALDVDANQDDVWTDEELAALFKPHDPLSGKQIVEKHLATGTIGSWADMGIEDSVEWLEQQKAKRLLS